MRTVVDSERGSRGLSVLATQSRHSGAKFLSLPILNGYSIKANVSVDLGGSISRRRNFISFRKVFQPTEAIWDLLMHCR